LTRNASITSRWRSSGWDRIAPAGSRDRAVAPDRIRAGVVRAAADDGERCRKERDRAGGREAAAGRRGAQGERSRAGGICASAAVELEPPPPPSSSRCGRPSCVRRHRIRRRRLLLRGGATHLYPRGGVDSRGGGGCRGTMRWWRAPGNEAPWSGERTAS
jgi:hypothetical protein